MRKLFLESPAELSQSPPYNGHLSRHRNHMGRAFVEVLHEVLVLEHYWYQLPQESKWRGGDV
jgi:hypothetical protein